MSVGNNGQQRTNPCLAFGSPVQKHWAGASPASGSSLALAAAILLHPLSERRMFATSHAHTTILGVPTVLSQSHLSQPSLRASPPILLTTTSTLERLSPEGNSPSPSPLSLLLLLLLLFSSHELKADLKKGCFSSLSPLSAPIR